MRIPAASETRNAASTVQFDYADLQSKTAREVVVDPSWRQVSSKLKSRRVSIRRWLGYYA